MKPSPELRAVMDEADRITSQSAISKRDEQRLNFLLSKAAAIRKGEISENRNKFFADLFRGNTEGLAEYRTAPTGFQEGTLSFVYSAGSAGGYLVPQEYHNEVLAGIAQIDPLLDASIVTLVESKDFSLRPYPVPSIDLSTYSAVKVSETSQQNEQTAPTAAAVMLNSFTYRASLPISMELEEDMFEPTQVLMKQAFTVGMARGIGVDLISGNGSSAPQGILSATDSGVTTAGAGAITATDIENIYFSLNRAYRSQPKCAWVMADATYELVRKAKDATTNRPLINVVGDMEYLMGKPVLVSPTMPVSAGSKGIVLGDLSRLVVRVSKLAVYRSVEVPGYVENGKALYTGLMRADAKIVDPTGGTTPPLVYATLHS